MQRTLKSQRVAGVLIATLIGIGASSASAQQEVDPAVARAQQLLKKVAAEKQQLEGELLKLRDELAKKDLEHKKELERLHDESIAKEATIEEAQAALTESQKSNLGLQGQLRNTQSSLGKTQGSLQEMTQKNADTEAKLADTVAKCEARIAELEGKLAEQTRWREDAEAKNLKLYQYNVELMNVYAQKGVMDSLLQREPFTGIKSVEVENILEEYSYKLDGEKVDPALRPTVDTPPATAPAAPAEPTAEPQS
jgi:chromosome segregation ATPase